MSNRKYPFVLATVLAVAMLVTSCGGVQNAPDQTGGAQHTHQADIKALSPVYGPMVKPSDNNTNRTKYDINIHYDEQSHSASVIQSVTYVNTASERMDTLYLHIYPNHFSKPEYVSMYFTRPDQTVYPHNEFNPGGITFLSVLEAGREADYTIEGADDTILRVPLHESLAMGQGIELQLSYTLAVPQRLGRFAWGETGASFANWYPIMAVFDQTGWNLDPYLEIGDPFYSEAADYKVVISMPAGMEAAYTGNIISDDTTEGRRILALSGSGVRDFAFVLSRIYRITERTVDGIHIRAALPKKYQGMTDKVLNFAEEAVHTYNNLFGKYTNDTLTIAFVDGFGGEYPGLVFVDKMRLKNTKNTDALRTDVQHEIAHQWWNGAVGSNEVKEPWLDESLASFSQTVISLEEKDKNAMALGAEELLAKQNSILEQALDEYANWNDYSFIYDFGPSFYIRLMHLMGEDKFYSMLQQYYATYAYGIATSQDLRALVALYGNEEAVRWFDRCVHGK